MSPRVWLGVALAAYAAVVLAVVLAPSVAGPDAVLGRFTELAEAAHAPPGVVDGGVEFAFNVAMVVPVAVIGSLLWSRPSWAHWTAGAFLLSSAVELVQGALLPLRDGSFSDIVANTAGCCLGALAVAGARAVAARRG